MSTMPAPRIPGHEIPTVPFPPTDGAMDATYQLVFSGVVTLVCLVVIFYAVRDWRRTGSPIALLILAGGALCVFEEPIVDIMGLCWFFRDGQWILMEPFGRPIPVWMLPVYTAYVGGQAWYTLNRLERGITTSGIWKLYLSYAAINVLLEEPPLYLGLYTYYGDAQPLQLGLLPLWWPAVNALMPIVSAAAIYRLKPYMGGIGLLLIVPLMPMADAVANAAVGLPVWTALNSSGGLWVTTGGAILTILLALKLVWILTIAVAADPAKEL